jgi:hypothetical protein
MLPQPLNGVRCVSRWHGCIKMGMDGYPGDYQSICEACEVSSLTINNVRKNYLESDLNRAILRKKPERVYERRLYGEGEAHLIALTCSKPPDGYERWSIRLLQDRLIRAEIVEFPHPFTYLVHFGWQPWISKKDQVEGVGLRIIFCIEFFDHHPCSQARDDA